MDHIPCTRDFEHPQAVLCIGLDTESSITHRDLQAYCNEYQQDQNCNDRDGLEAPGSRPFSQTERLTQKWFFFGVLSSFFALKIKTADFVAERNGTRYLSTSRLNTFLRDWLVYKRSLRIGHFDTEQEAIAELLWERCDRFTNEKRLTISHELLHVLCVLGRTLNFAILQLNRRANLRTDVRTGHLHLFSLYWHSTDLLKWLFEERGWCQNDMYRLTQLVSVNALSYVVTLRRAENVDHHKCTQNECVTNNIDEATFQSQHLYLGCKCPFIHDTGQQSSDILQHESYPVVDLTSIADGKVRLIPYKPGMPFTAISHVWSHGLGNPAGNSVATCQLLHILILARTISKHPYIWLDTLCVPREIKYRRKAIMLMARTFNEASQVLVLDAELRYISSKTIPIYEVFARVAISGWMRRVWTLFEGVAANRLFAAFSDQVLDLTAAVEEVNEHTNSLPFELNMVPIEFMLQIGMLQCIGRAAQRKPEFFINAWNAIRLRRTSWRGDEIICFAQMMGQPVQTILDAESHEEKMMACLDLFDELPMAFLFTFGKKLQIDGYRWAPASFLQEERVGNAVVPMLRVAGGLNLTSGCIWLECGVLNEPEEKADFLDSSGSVLSVRVGSSWKFTDVFPNLLGSQLAILTGNAIGKGPMNLPMPWVAGALVRLKSTNESDEKQRHYTTYECGIEYCVVVGGAKPSENIGRSRRSDGHLAWHMA